MYTVIFAAVLGVVALLCIGLGLLKGRKNVWIYSALKIGAVILSALIAFLLSKLLLRGIITSFLNKLLQANALGDAGAIIKEMPSAVPVVSAIICMIAAPFLFWMVFAILKKILYFVAKLVSRVLIKIPALAPVRKDPQAFEEMSKRKQKKLALRTSGVNPIGMALGATLGLLLFLVAMVPILGTVGVANDIVGTVAVMGDDAGLQTVYEITDAADNNFMSVSARALGSKAVYNGLTTYKIGDSKASLEDELEFVTIAGKGLYAMSNTENKIPKEEAAKAITDIGEAFSETTIVPTLAAELLSAAGEDWAQGKSFHGMDRPAIEGFEDISKPLFNALSNSTTVTIREDVNTITHILASAVEHGAIEKLQNDQGTVMALFEDTELSYEIIYELLENDRLAPMVGEITEVGFDMLGDQFHADFKGLHIDSSAIADKNAGAHELANVLCHVANLVDKVNAKGFDAFELAKDFGPLLDEIDHTQLIGHNNTAIVLKGIFTSYDLYSQIGLSKIEAGDIADSINEKSAAKGYTPLIISVLDTIDIIRMTTDANISNAEMVAKVEVLLADLTPESAELLQEMTSESVMLSKGAPAQSAKPMSDMFSNAFSGLAEAKQNGMSDEEYKKEAKAMTDMMNVAMNFENSSSQAMFGQSSATGVEADEFVNNVFDSTVISGTIVDTVYADGDQARVDPLNFGAQLNENDRNNTVNALNNQWANSTEEERAADANTYVAIGALMNMNVVVTDNGVVAY